MKTAKVTVRDSSDMRAIAWVTLAFLPATFVATFFSTSILSFEQEGAHVSDWVWLHCVVSVALTLSVLARWALWVRRDHTSYIRR
ncbi:Fc.00g058440.m01.CDS01 [Cosmosporella sp. VM-42]